MTTLSEQTHRILRVTAGLVIVTCVMKTGVFAVMTLKNCNNNFRIKMSVKPKPLWLNSFVHFYTVQLHNLSAGQRWIWLKAVSVPFSVFFH